MEFTRYTSFETSVALRDAEAPQGPDRSEIGETFWRCYESRAYSTMRRSFEVRRERATWTPGAIDGQPGDVPGEARAFRLDELIEQLTKVGIVYLAESVDGTWYCLCDLVGDEGDGFGAHQCASPVEAAAGCLLAVLRSRA